MVDLVLILGGQRGPDFVGHVVNAVKQLLQLCLLAKVLLVFFKVGLEVFKIHARVQRSQFDLSLLDPVVKSLDQTVI